MLTIQNIKLTPQEFDALVAYYQFSPDKKDLVNYVKFNEEIAAIFTEKDLEKNPTKTLSAFNAPSCLDPKPKLNAQEEM